MKLIVCLDDSNGMAFHNRRQSMDCVLRDRIVALVGENVFRMNGYSEKQFTTKPSKTFVSEDFLDIASADDYCLVETCDLTHYLERVSEVVIFRWNRRYPADLYFPIEVLSAGFQKVSVTEFVGNSHDKITQEVYNR